MRRKWCAVMLAVVMLGASACGDGGGAGGAAGESSKESTGNTEAVSEVLEAAEEAIAPPTSYVNEEEMALADQWQSCNDAALAKVMRKAANKEAITIACIGGSITQGSISKGSVDGEVAESKPYADIFHEWWEVHFPDTEVAFVNAGIGGTDSYLGVHRVKKDVLEYQPDLVLVEYAVNDGSNNFYKRSYDNLLRNILKSENSPAVMLLFMAQTNGISAQSTQVLVGYHYGLPMVSYANCIKSMMESGHYTAEQLSGDEVHPSALGHAIVGELLWNYLNAVYAERDNYAEPEIFEMEAVTDDRYKNADILDASSVTPDSLGTFTERSTSNFFPNGWVCEEGDGELTVTMSFRNLGLLYLATTDGCSGQFDIWVDGECVWTVNADFSGGWGNAVTATEIFTSKETTEHTVVIKKAADSTGDVLKLLGFLVS